MYLLSGVRLWPNIKYRADIDVDQIAIEELRQKNLMDYLDNLEIINSEYCLNYKRNSIIYKYCRKY